MSTPIYTDSRGWLWQRHPDRAGWELVRIGEIECYGKDLHIWANFNWMGDGKWHVGRGGSPMLDRLFDTAEEAMEAALPVALEDAGWALRRAEAELERRKRVMTALGS